MKEGIVKEIKEYFRYGEKGEEIPITREEYDKEMEKANCGDRDPFLGLPVGYSVYKDIRLSVNSIYGIVGLLNYDRGLNKFALEYGYHPASGYKKCSSHLRNVKLRDKQLALFGEKSSDDMPSSLAKERCKKCRQ